MQIKINTKSLTVNESIALCAFFQSLAQLGGATAPFSEDLATVPADGRATFIDAPDPAAVFGNPLDVDAPIAETAAPITAGVPVDNWGTPYDPKIHQKTREGTGVIGNDGRWKPKKGTAPTATTPPPPSQVAEEPSQDVPAPPQPVPTVTVASTHTPTQGGGGAGAMATVQAPVGFADFMGRLSQKQASDSSITNRVVERCKEYGLPGLAGLASRQDLLVACIADFGL